MTSWWPRFLPTSTPVDPVPSSPSTQAFTPPTADALTRIAYEHLPTELADQWLTLLRPAVALVPHVGTGPTVARFGGQPLLPDDTAWPVRDGHGPLAYIAELHCDTLTGFDLDITIPTSGRLLFFYWDGSLDGGVEVIGYWDPPSLTAGAVVIHVPAATPCTLRPIPDGVHQYPERVMAGAQVATYPHWNHAVVEAAFLGATVGLDHPVAADEFTDALWDTAHVPRHQVGGYACPVQHTSVEDEVAMSIVGQKASSDVVADEAATWRLLLQVDTDDDLGMGWGDAGTLYWLTRDSSTAELGQTSFTWQCM